MRARLLDIVCSSSATHVTLCGGEPLVIKELPEIVRRLALSGKQVIINTNGELLTSPMIAALQLGEFVQIIGISLDGHTHAQHAAMRGKSASFEKSVSAARLVASMRSATLKIGTVVSRVNASDVAQMAALVDELGASIWRLYQFAPRNGNEHAEARHSVSTSDFFEYVDRASRLARQATVSSSSVDQSRGCFILSHEGSIVEPTTRGHNVVGHVLQGPIDWLWNVPSDRQAHVSINKRWLSLSKVGDIRCRDVVEQVSVAHAVPSQS